MACFAGDLQKFPDHMIDIYKHVEVVIILLQVYKLDSYSYGGIPTEFP